MKALMTFWVWLVLMSGNALAQNGAAFSDRLDGLNAKPGFFDLYLDEDAGDIYAVLPAADDRGISLRFIYTTGLSAGLGSNPIGLDRGDASNGAIVRFRKVGDKIVAEQENLKYRASAERPEEKLAVAQSFATSFIWSTDILATAPNGALLIDLSGFLVRDQFGIASALKHGEDAGDYALASDRSFPDPGSALAFPDNVEVDAFLTFETSKPNAQTLATAPDARAVTLSLHHSFVRLPDADYRPRKFDQRTANIGMGYYDYSSRLDQPIVQRLSRRFRLELEDPASGSGAVKSPIVFYVDAGAPEEIRDALIEGASWWAEGFEAAGFEDAYRVEVLPDDVHPLDVRYNVINWVHRQTRGWSYGGSVSDPRTGEILKANVILGSQRVRQDRMIFEGLAGVAATGTGRSDDPLEISLARIRQLAAHEVGHTLGFAHNFAASANDRASVMDYPAPYVRPSPNGTLDFSNAYDVGLGAWDIFTVKWLYTQFGDDVGEDDALDDLVREAYGSGLRFVGDRHGRSVSTAHPYASVWDNGADAIATLEETMDVRRIALADFGLDRLAEGRASSDLNAVIVPIYLYHRYQVVAAAKYIGGLDFRYGINGDGAAAAEPVEPAEQRRALAALLATLDPAELDLPDRTLNLLTPGDVGFAGGGQSLEVFPQRTGPVFDLHMAADIAATLTLSALFDAQRLERLMSFAHRDGDGLTVRELIQDTEAVVFQSVDDPRHVSLARTVQARFVTLLIERSSEQNTSLLVAGIIDGALAELSARLSNRRAARTPADRSHFALLTSLIAQHLERERSTPRSRPEVPPGSPIGVQAFGEDCWHCAPVGQD
ncbi:MAG: zinc-dependent metalloprotease [Pseudomonadota bacterium]